MSVDIPRSGTRGAQGPPRGAVGRMLTGVARRVHRLTGSKMSGRPLLYLTTVGAKSGQPRTAVVKERSKVCSRSSGRRWTW